MKKKFLRLGAVLLCGALLGGCVRLPAPPPETTEPLLTPNPYTALDFDYKDGYLTCISGDSISGVDVSSYQGKIDWEAVHSDGFDFAMVRLGFRGWGDGSLHTDDRALENLDNAAEAGMMRGGYFFSQALTPEEAVEEAELALAILDGRRLELPIVCDWEMPGETARTAGMDGAALTECVKAFCEKIREAGYTPMIYFNLHFIDRYLYLEELRDYDFWFALYDSPMSCPVRVDMWQYTCTGLVSGIEGNVDLDLLLLYD